MQKDEPSAGGDTVIKAKISKAAILMDWLVLPCVLLIVFLSVCLPVLGGIYSSAHKVEVIADALGLEEIKFSDLVENMGIAFRIPEFLVVFLYILLGLLTLCWLGWACVKTCLHFGYEITATEDKVFVKAKGKYLESLWSEVKNVYVEQSLWGKIFCYGSVTVHASGGAVTVRDVVNPKVFRTEFFKRTSNNLY